MFLQKRSSESEHFDLEHLPSDAIDEGYRDLDRVNRFFRFSQPFQKLIPQYLGEETSRNLTILDVGAGTGKLAAELTEWARSKGWNWKFVNLDLKPQSFAGQENGMGVAGSAVHLPFADKSFDVVVGTQMTHHLTSEKDVTLHFAEAYRVSRRIVLFYDLQRTLFLFTFIWFFCLAMRVSKQTRHDGLISVKKGWRKHEWERLARDAGMKNIEVFNEHAARIFLKASRD